MARYPSGSVVRAGVVYLAGKIWVPHKKRAPVQAIICKGPGLCERTCGPLTIPEGEDPPTLCPYDGHLVEWGPVA